MKNAYITLLSSEKYLIGVLALNESLKRVHSKNPLVILVTKDISQHCIDILKKNNIIITIQNKEIVISDQIKQKNSEKGASNWNLTFDKLSIFSLTEYSTLIYLDSDLYIRKNIDHLFEKEHLSATIDRHRCVIDKDYIKLTSGIMVIKPEVNLAKKLTDTIEQFINKFECFGDQDIIQEYYSDWSQKSNLHLPITYNMFFVDIDFYMKENIENTICSYKNIYFEKYHLDDISVFHFIVDKKPWDFKNVTDYLDFIKTTLFTNYLAETSLELKEICKIRAEMSMTYRTIIATEYFNILHTIGGNNEYKNLSNSTHANHWQY